VYNQVEEFSFQRSLEQVPSTFTMNIACNTTLPSINDNDTVQIYLNKKMIFSGYVEIRDIDVNGNSSHTYTISGRSNLKKICDATPIYAGTSINNINNLEDLCDSICSQYSVKVINKSTKADKTAWNSVPYNLGDTGWSILDRYARYQGKLLYDNGYGALVINDVSTNSTTQLTEGTSPIVNQRLSTDITQRYHQYIVVWAPYSTAAQTGIPPEFTAYDPNTNLFAGENRTLIMINSTSDNTGSLAQSYAYWNANRRYGRSRVVNVTVASFTDGSGNLWDVNQMATLNLPSIGVVNEQMVIASVNYAYSNGGSLVSLELMPATAFSMEPTVLYSSDASLQTIPQTDK